MNKSFKYSRTTQAFEQNVQKVHGNEQLNKMFKKSMEMNN